ncbi:MAG: class I SAM-dependent rRNA methyltransferase [Acidobacteria bacterium]|nr:class I SAM-dependent rRNA methyltransferase [Acidobacteriota bacterium]
MDTAPFARALDGALRSRAALIAQPDVTAWRVLDGKGDGVPGLSIDRYGPAAVMNVYDDAGLPDEAVTAVAAAALERLAPLGVESVYVKPFVRDRSRLGGALGDEATSPVPRAGTPQPDVLVVEEYGTRFEVRVWDGLSTGLFLDHREHRRALAARCPSRVLNLFAYTCAFSMPLARAGAHVTNVDVSGRYLDWGRRNLALNGLDGATMRFLRRDAMEYLAQAARREDERYGLVILDPPTFAAANKRRGVAAWRAADDYPALVGAAVRVLAPGGAIFAASNTRELASAGALADLIDASSPRPPRWLELPPWPVDVRERNRVAAVLFAP